MPQLLKIAERLMLVSGSWRLPSNQSFLFKKVYNIYSGCIQTYYGFFVALLIADVPFLWHVGVEKVAENIGFATILTVMFCKLVMCQSAKMKTLLLQAIAKEIQIYETENEATQQNYIGSVQHANRINSVLILCTSTVCFLFCLAHFLELSQRDVEVPVLLNLWYPFDSTEHYVLAYVLAMTFTLVGTLYNCVTQVLFVTLMIYVISQLKILQISVERLALKELAIRHQEIIKYVGDLNDSMRYLMMLEFLLNSLNLASVMFQILVAANTWIFTVFYAAFFVLLVLQLFSLAWNANEIKLQSMALSDSLFQSKWYTQTKSTRRMVHIMMIRSQKPLTISVGSFYPMTLGTAITSMKAAYSYVTMIIGFCSET